MTIRDFLDASYALMAEEHQRVNPLSTLLDMAEKIEPRKMERPTPARKQDTGAKNEESLNLLTAAMSNVRGPTRPTMKRNPRV